MENEKRDYQVCTNCVMDTTDSKITFDEKGVCDHCRNFEKNIRPYWNPNENRMDELQKIADKIRKAGKGHDYDCILGLSGGADSSYLAYIAKEVMHLRPLAFVVDTGWNLNVAVENIEKIVKGLELDMYTEVINWKEMADLQLSFFKAQISSQDFLQDHAIFASLYNYATKHHIKYVLTGSNNATEFIRPPVEWIYMNDIRMMRDIHNKYGRIPLKTFPQCGMFKYRLLYKYIYGMERVYPLDYVVYNKAEAEIMLHEKYGWERYENKHYENVFTRFFEGYYLPTKFGFDTRKNVYSNQILAGTMTRDEAIELLKQPAYDPDMMEQDKEYIAKKLGISTEEFEKIIAGENKTPQDYKNTFWLIKLAVKACKLLGIENRNIR
ncbi:N-acetyl sugar amidotransferase [Eubacterium sp. AM05-23]|uniref:N-acetyl sugar amidotransferase n=1 Tax=Eubacterium TaxID=1730 RepID=UPI000E4F0310|nr:MULTISPECIES: N-acetyl sugar amidotransferase [Eubacterium]RHO57310.1 N-acetyl sugar amidotransferase [Eubacterium sp. AM05-23]